MRTINFRGSDRRGSFLSIVRSGTAFGFDHDIPLALVGLGSAKRIKNLEDYHFDRRRGHALPLLVSAMKVASRHSGDQHRLEGMKIHTEAKMCRRHGVLFIEDE